MIKFTDFEPRIIEKGFFSPASFESMQTIMDQINEWIIKKNIHVINIETVVLPNIHKYGEEGTEDVDLRTPGESSSFWHQFIRVWHRE